jgi:Na+/proline symporter
MSLGSIFYGPILGVFLVALFLKKDHKWSAVFYATVLTQLLIFCYLYSSKNETDRSWFLWLNPIGAFRRCSFCSSFATNDGKKKNPAMSRVDKYFIERILLQLLLQFFI